MGYILVVDDQEINRDILVRRLSKKGFDMIEADSGQKALDLIANESIDLVLLDVRMPNMDGNEVLEKIRINHSSADLPVIMVTAESDSITMIKSLGLGANDYVTKPVDIPVLLARIENKLRLSKNLKERLSTSHHKSKNSISIKELVEKGEGNNIEFKSSLRWNILAGKVGKEIEIAWLKTIVAFLNSDGGTLLIGVDDAGKVLGTDIDKFKNNDKYLLHVNNCIKEAIGLEYSSHIQFDLVAYQNNNVLCVICQSHEEPVFLNNNGVEEFYVRFGPSSRKLTMKEVIHYNKNRSM